MEYGVENKVKESPDYKSSFRNCMLTTVGLLALSVVGSVFSGVKIWNSPYRKTFEVMAYKELNDTLFHLKSAAARNLVSLVTR